MDENFDSVSFSMVEPDRLSFLHDRYRYSDVTVLLYIIHTCLFRQPNV